MRLRLLVLPLFLFAACGGDHASTGGDALAGHWSPVGKVGELEVGLEFDGKGDKVVGHVDGPDGHVHPPGLTYSFDAATKKVTLKGKVLGDGKADTWTGTLGGDTLELVGGTDKFTVKKGGKAH
ncbi:MAG: hypothetical protein JNK15_18315 [Planctomycetes bacterium]|nr:hypothetical protein [Planctomycetota bacterium]